MGALRRHLSDQGVLRLVDRGERLLARLLSLVLLAVLALATVEFLWHLVSELLLERRSWVGDSLIALLGDLLNLLIGLEVLQNITSYLRRGVVQIDLVLITAMTAVGRKVIVLPPGAENKPELLMGLGVAVLCLAVALWLVRSPGRPSANELRDSARTEPARSSQDADSWPSRGDADRL
jgi:uncharacterized membrane protein (DUF373 family)